jgi:hypothetical protein
VGIIWTIVLGFVIGVVAKLIHPGKENMGLGTPPRSIISSSLACVS